MPLGKIPEHVEKRKAKRGVTPGRSKSSYWPKTPYKDYTKYKHSDLIKTSTGKRGKIMEKGSPGQEGRTHTKAMKRLNEIQKIRSREGTRMTSGAQGKRKEHLQSGGYKAGGRANFRGGGRTNLLEELGRVEGERSNKNRRAEIIRVHGELNKGYKAGGRIGLKEGGGRGTYGGWPKGGPSFDRPKTRKDIKPGRRLPVGAEGIFGLGEKGKPHSSPEGRKATSKLARQRLMGGKKYSPKQTGGDKVSPGRPGGKGPKKDKRWNKGDKFMTPLRAKKAAGGVLKAGKRFLDFIKTGKPHVDHGKRKKIKHLGKGKASGGRIGLKHGGGGAQQHYLQHGYGPHKLKVAKASDKALRGNKLTKKA